MTLVQVFNLALKLHDGQRDKAGEPYIGHLVRTLLRLPADATLLEQQAALLHDALEDGGAAVIDAFEAAGVSYELSGAVVTLTRGRLENYDQYIMRVARSPMWRVKIADIEDNSDPSRLAKLDPGVAARLKTKYELAKTAIYAAQAK